MMWLTIVGFERLRREDGGGCFLRILGLLEIVHCRQEEHDGPRS